MRTKTASIEGLLGAIEQQKNDRDFNILKDLKMLQQRYTNTSKRDYMALLAALVQKYETEEAALVHAALIQKCRAGDVEAIRLYGQMRQQAGGECQEVTIVDSI